MKCFGFRCVMVDLIYCYTLPTYGVIQLTTSSSSMALKPSTQNTCRCIKQRAHLRADFDPAGHDWEVLPKFLEAGRELHEELVEVRKARRDVTPEKTAKPKAKSGAKDVGGKKATPKGAGKVNSSSFSFKPLQTPLSAFFLGVAAASSATRRKIVLESKSQSKELHRQEPVSSLSWI